LRADKGYDYGRCRKYLRQRGIAARIARKGVENKKASAPSLGRRTPHAWFAGFGKLRIRVE